MKLQFVGMVVAMCVLTSNAFLQELLSPFIPSDDKFDDSLLTYNYKHGKRQLRGRGGGRSGGRSSSRSRRSSYYSRSSSSSYSTRSTTRTSYNMYLSNGRTYGPLYSYYMPIGYYSAIGYYSYLYLITYYNGYGYNFYYGAYGYYENSATD